MQNMHSIKSGLFSRRGIIASIAMVGVLALALFLVPQKTNLNTAAEDCGTAPQTPTFNYWPVTYDRTNTPLCHDFVAIDAAVNAQYPQFSTSASDWSDGLQMTSGQEGVAMMYLHNGAANSLDPELTTAKNVKIQTVTSSTVGSSHQISVTYTADNAPSYTRSYTVHTPANSTLEVIPNSGNMYDYEGRLILDQQNLNLGNSTFTLGDLDACFEFSLFLTFKFKVVTPIVNDNTTLALTKEVRNVTQNGVFQKSVTANQNEKVQYRVKVRNTGTSVALGVTMTDNGVNGITITSGSTTVDATNLQQGNVPGTINLGDMQPGAERTITYEGTVTVASGTLVNTARAQGSNTNEASDTATVIVNTVVNDNTTITIVKEVRNVTNNGSYQNSASAKNNDQVQYRIIVRNTGNTVARGVTMSDNGVNGITVTSGSTTVGIADDALLANNLWQGAVPGTVNIGDIPVNQQRVITYSGRVTTTQCGDLTNTARAQASNAPMVSDTAIVSVTGCGGGSTDREISIEKLVRNENHNTSYSNSQSIRTGEWATWKVTVRNTGDTSIQNVRLDDVLPSGLNIDNDSIRLDGTRINSIRDINLGTLRAGESKVLIFSSQVTATGTRTICNEASVRGDSVGTKRDDACVTITVTDKPGDANIVKAKRAHNDTKNADATTVNAAREDYITYTLVTTNTGNGNAVNFVISDDLSKVLAFADLVDAGGATLSGNTLTYSGVTIRPGETITKTFKVRVKHSLQENLSYQLINTYGNTVVINIPGKVIHQAPKTGAAGTSAAVFAGLLTAGFVTLRKSRSILNFIKA